MFIALRRSETPVEIQTPIETVPEPKVVQPILEDDPKSFHKLKEFFYAIKVELDQTVQKLQKREAYLLRQQRMAKSTGNKERNHTEENTLD